MVSVIAYIAGEITLSKNSGESFKKWRNIFNISQIELAKYLKVKPSTLSDYEGGRRKNPGIKVVARFVEALVEIDKKKGGKVLARLEADLPHSSAFELHEFYTSISGIDFMKKINAKCIVNMEKLKDTKIYGVTIVDSIKMILDTPVHEYLKLYGKTPERALIFKQVETGRSPMIAVKIGKFSTEIAPSIVVLHSKHLTADKVDKVAVGIAKKEKIPLLLAKEPIEKIINSLSSLEV